MRVINLCRHRTAGWEGVIYTDGRGEVKITNGVCIWSPTPERMEALEMMETVDTQRLLSCMTGRPQMEPVAALLKGELPDFRQDVEYLSRPLIESMCYEISDTQVRVTCPHTCFVNTFLEDSFEQESLLDSYRQVLRLAKANNVRISYSAHVKRTLLNEWKEYEVSDAERASMFHRLVEQARIVEVRGIHYGCCDDKELSLLTELRNQLLPYGYRNSVRSRMARVARHLTDLRSNLTNGAVQYSMICL